MEPPKNKKKKNKNGRKQGRGKGEEEEGGKLVKETARKGEKEKERQKDVEE